ncbi:MAG: hypothetical protein ACE5EM_10060 [Sphingomonadales bacterium]
MAGTTNRIPKWLRTGAVLALVTISAGAVGGCSIFGSDKEKTATNDFISATNIGELRKDKPGLPGDHANARHTDEVLRGDED